MATLHNPEHAWERPDAIDDIRLEDVESRIGPVAGKVSVLSGGLANSNILIGADRVLRIYRQDIRRLEKERRLLNFGWKALDVPEVLAAGDDFLLLAYVAHTPLQDDGAQARAVGKALAEIHAKKFAEAGELNGNLELQNGWEDLLEALFQFSHACLTDPAFKRLDVEVQGLFDRMRPELRAALGTPVLVHSDFKVSNVHWGGNGRPLILDWETAYAGSPLSDIGQLFRWAPSGEFESAFERGYLAGGGELPRDWRRWARLLDLVNLTSLLKDSKAGGRRREDVLRGIGDSLSFFGWEK